MASTWNGLDLYSSFDEGNATLERTYHEGIPALAHLMSKDGTYLVFGFTDLQVYKNDNTVQCDLQYCTKCLN